MSLLAILNPISKIRVGTGDEYAVTKINETHRRVGLDDSNTDSYTETTWQLECLAEISAPTSIAALNEQLRSQLAKRGLVVTLTERGTARTMPATGSSGGSMIGYPMVEITAIPDKSFAQYQAFNLRAITRVPILDGDGIWMHDQSSETTTNIDGTQVTTVTGILKMDQGEDARAYVQDEIITPARTAAGEDGDGVVSKIKTGNDPAQCEYSYTVSPSNTGTIDVTQAQVDDRVAKDQAGRWVRTITGYATGPAASTFASSQRVAEASNLVLMRDDISQPAVPDGRVSFSYQYASGVTHAEFPGLFITRMEESVDEGGGGREILAAVYLQNNPALRLGNTLPVVMSESLSIEFIGSSFSGIDPDALLDADNQIGEPRISKKASGVFKTWTRSISYLYDTKPDPVPDPRSLDGIS